MYDNLFYFTELYYVLLVEYQDTFTCIKQKNKKYSTFHKEKKTVY